MQPYQLSLSAAAAQIEAKELSPVELTDSVLGRIDAVESTLNAFAAVTADVARKAASDAEQEIMAGTYRGPLHGIPLGVKDLYETAGIPTTSSSQVRAGSVPETDAAMVEKLLTAGMVLVGKTHTHEFAYGATTPTTRNPWDPERVPGGSSGGSGAAVAAGECMVGLGSDTGGSIRIPAAVCGTVGLKPTYGRISRRGVASLSWSLDHVGPLTRNVVDAAHVLAATAGFDRADPATVDVPVPDYVAELAAVAGRGVQGLRVGVPGNFYFDHVDPEVEASVRAAIGVLEGLGATLVEVTVPYAAQYRAVSMGILAPEAAAYHQQDIRANPELYTDEVRVALEAGELVLATDYINALRVRTLIQQAWKAMFDGIDVLAAPSVPIPAPRADQHAITWDDGLTERPTDCLVRLSGPANITGLPALSLPTAPTAGGLPVGMQLIGRPFAESTLLATGQAFEAATDSVGLLAPL
ncbi:MAG: Aspartyl-tRNA(Asn)/glutamyl-tRNA(Gln) amidotransferase subunit [Modestobacter sp.]|nr:Aspartyl-tRNA(Asn)/glutamyl-tRNA(Gln) amidotransferase subunit [Modestobacter sp.]